MNKTEKAIIELFYKNKGNEFHLREIVRRTNINESMISRTLTKFKKENFLNFKQYGNTKNYHIIRSPLVFKEFIDFDLKRIQKINDRRQTAIKHLIGKTFYKSIFIILFGSTAKNTYRKDSDIDVLVVTNSNKNFKEVKEYVDAQFAIELNIFQITYKNLLKTLKYKDDHVVLAAIETGIPLTNHLMYYRCVFDEYFNVKEIDEQWNIT